MKLKLPDGTVVFYRSIEAVEARDVAEAGWCVVVRGASGHEYAMKAGSRAKAESAREKIVAAVEAFTGLD